MKSQDYLAYSGTNDEFGEAVCTFFGDLGDVLNTADAILEA